ncbi:MAG: aminotransferase class I/II-fold pyridoxal phosphate-dependent enzyme [Oscillospiraceae bacterium]|nr:aminotransferase class I/II-fold pyridoxal phosphate-dependent enzyme [Oscillospiraceae bacterium]
MQAIILAAGMGKRLKNLTANNTKCMVKVNGVPMIDRVLRQLDAHRLSRIILVVGYEGEKLKAHVRSLPIFTPVDFVDNPIYDKTNNIYSLALAKRQLCAEDTLLLESDLIFEDSVLDLLLDDPRPNLALVDKYESWMDGTCVLLDENDGIDSFVPKKSFRYDEISRYYKTVNIYKFSKEFSQKQYVPFLNAYVKALGENEYYEQVLRVITMLNHTTLRAKRLEGQRWYEIDDVQDLDIAESIFTESVSSRAEKLQGRYGGYWRYPGMLDFCYLVNPYFPPRRMMDEIKASFETLLTQYPSGMHINSLLAAKDFGVAEQNILVGNGAAELIKAFMERLSGKTGIIRPSFEEYGHRYADQVEFRPENPDFSYTADDLMHFYDAHPVRSLILINPDNPSGNYIQKADVLRLIRWSAERGITLLLDESFVDFADEEDSSLLDQTLLNQNPHLFVMKSISKSYGVPGLRLGILASGDTEAIAALKKDVSIWNINSFAEFYLQIEEKYQQDYRNGMALFRAERARFAAALARIPGLRVIPSQANYLMVELTNPKLTAKELLAILLSKYNLLVKELTAKTGGQYLRFAVRDTADNDRLLAALRRELAE